MNGLTTRERVALPAEVSRELLRLKGSPERYYAVITAERPEDERQPTALTVSAINRGLGRDGAMLALAIAIKEVRDFFNVKGNMTESQIALTAELILDNPAFYDLSLGNIKACFRRQMREAKLYDRLDGNIIIGWLKEFKSEMADCCYESNLEKEKKETEAEGVTFELYVKLLAERAGNGDLKAKKILVDIQQRNKTLSSEEKHDKDLEFFKYRAEYLKSKGII